MGIPRGRASPPVSTCASRRSTGKSISETGATISEMARPCFTEVAAQTNIQRQSGGWGVDLGNVGISTEKAERLHRSRLPRGRQVPVSSRQPRPIGDLGRRRDKEETEA